MSFVPNTDFLIEVAKGNVPGQSLVAKFGRDPSINTADGFADIWTVPINNKVWLTSPVTLEAISTSANDITAGSGAQIITVQGLDGSFLDLEEDITMNGTAASTATANSFIRVNRMFVKQTGTYRGSNEGDISVRISGGGVVQSNILTGKGQTEQSQFTIPANKYGILLQAYISVDTTKTASGELYQIPGADDVTTPFVGAFRKVWGVTGLTGAERHVFEAKTKIIGPADMLWRANVNANNTPVEAGFNLLLVEIT